MNKFGARKAVSDGITFDSQAEASRYQDLKLMQLAGAIRGLKVHPVYPLVVQSLDRTPQGGSGTLVCNYEADFEYERAMLNSWKLVTEDVKGYRAGAAWSVFRLKAKLFRALYGRDVEIYPSVFRAARRRRRP